MKEYGAVVGWGLWNEGALRWVPGKYPPPRSATGLPTGMTLNFKIIWYNVMVAAANC